MANTSWPEVVVQASPATAEALENWLFAAGALSITYRDQQDQPILEPAPGEVPLWDEISLIGLFAQGSNEASIQDALQLAAVSEQLPLPAYQIQALQDKPWERSWMDDFKPMQFGANLWVCPSHHSPPEPDAITVMLDPGLAFGTGTHATTSQCLAWLGNLSQNTDNNPLKGKSVIDFGCGSGVLGIAAALLGAQTVYAVDIDEQALIATRQNADANGVGEQLQISDAEHLKQLQVDVLLANILFEPLTQLADDFAKMVRPGGLLVMSGILLEQVEPL